MTRNPSVLTKSGQSIDQTDLCPVSLARSRHSRTS